MGLVSFEQMNRAKNVKNVRCVCVGERMRLNIGFDAAAIGGHL